MKKFTPGMVVLSILVATLISPISYSKASHEPAVERVTFLDRAITPRSYFAGNNNQVQGGLAVQSKAAQLISERSSSRLSGPTEYTNLPIISTLNNYINIESEPIAIFNDTQLGQLSSRGSGSFEDPFIIENLIIETNSSKRGLEIKNTNAYLVVQNNVFTHSNLTVLGGGISFTNSNNWQLQNNIVMGNGEEVIGVQISDGSNFAITSNLLNQSQEINAKSVFNFTISANLIKSRNFGIRLQSAFDFAIFDNYVETVSSDRALLIEGDREITLNVPDFSLRLSGRFEIYNNLFSGGTSGVIGIDDAFDFKILNNTIGPPTIITPSVLIRFSENVEFSNNTLSSFLRQGTVFRLDMVSQAYVSSNIFRSFTQTLGGVLRSSTVVLSGDSITFLHNTILSSLHHGVYVELLTNSKITNNTVGSLEEPITSSGIYVTASENLTISDNEIKKSGSFGIQLQSVGLGKPVNITISYNIIESGVKIADTTVAVITDNWISEAPAGVDIKDSNNIGVYSNTIESNSVGIKLLNVSSTIIMSNTISENSRLGLEIFSSSEIMISNNVVSFNGEGGILITQLTGLGQIYVSSNNITDHGLLGSFGIEVDNLIESDDTSLFILENSILDNYLGISLHGQNTLIESNKLIGPDFDQEGMLYGLEILPGSRNNLIRYNDFDQALVSHISIRSTNNFTDSTKLSSNNLFVWNNFYRTLLVPAYDQFAQNLFIYNYWENYDSETQEGRYELAEDPISEVLQFDLFPLENPSVGFMLVGDEVMPDPLILMPIHNQKIKRDLNESSLLIFWRQYISSEHFLDTSLPKFEYLVEIRRGGTLIQSIELAESFLYWDISNIDDGLYNIKIKSTLLSSGEVVLNEIRVNLGPVSTDNLTDNPIVIGGGLLALLVTTGASVFAFSSYRHRREIRRQADHEGRAREYIDFVKEIREDEE